jgi:hypothetical protein
MNVSGQGNAKTASEVLFEECLTAHGYAEWAHEPQVEGKLKKPDYHLKIGDSTYLFEVKEFDPQPPALGFGAFDPYPPIRGKLNQAARQLGEYKEHPCSVVLANPNNAFVHLDPHVIQGAMLGNVGFQVQVGVRPDEGHPIEQVFTGGGKMINYKRQEPQNTTINAIVVLGRYPLREKRIRMAIREHQKELGRETTLEEDLSFYDALPDAPELHPVRVMVHENPFARIPLSRDLFQGPFDERWGVDGIHIRRIYVGWEIGAVEAALGEG